MGMLVKDLVAINMMINYNKTYKNHPNKYLINQHYFMQKEVQYHLLVNYNNVSQKYNL